MQHLGCQLNAEHGCRAKKAIAAPHGAALSSFLLPSTLTSIQSHFNFLSSVLFFLFSHNGKDQTLYFI